VLRVAHIKDAVVGSTYTFPDVLLVGSSSKTVVGRPLVPSAVVSAVVEEQTHEPTITVLKKKRRKTAKRMWGHRRDVTILRVTSIQPGIEL
jgi:large subunit ribosomal protein L21